MKTVSLILFAVLMGAAGASGAHDCKCTHGALPPLPPMPPMPPMPPLPPAPPALPPIPAKAHAACAGKSAGSTVTVVIRKGETMSGTCTREGGRMVFDLDSYHTDNF